MARFDRGSFVIPHRCEDFGLLCPWIDVQSLLAERTRGASPPFQNEPREFVLFGEVIEPSHLAFLVAFFFTTGASSTGAFQGPRGFLTGARTFFVAWSSVFDALPGALRPHVGQGVFCIVSL